MNDTAPPPLLPAAVRADACLGCGGPWDADGKCALCGLTGRDATELLASACAAYRSARDAALTGRFAEARALIAEARDGGLTDQPALARLDALCIAALHGGPDLGESAIAEYRAARTAAARGAWDEAARGSELAAGAAPWCLPARKLHLLCLAATGQSGEASRRRAALRAHVPAEPDLCRWDFADAPGGPVRSVRRALKSGRLPARPSRLPATEAKSRRFPTASVAAPPLSLRRLIVLAGTGAACGTIALLVAALSYLRAPAHPAAILPVSPAVVPAPIVATGPPRNAALETLDAASRREYEETRATADERQARRWLNAAVNAQKSHDYAEAERLARAAYAVGRTSYLADDALWVAAQASDKADSPLAAARFARIFLDRPGSPYASVAMAEAARIARRQDRPDEADNYLNLLKRR